MSEYISREAALAEQKLYNTYTSAEMAVPVEALLDIPVANVVEVRHGRWREAMGASGVVRMACTNCGFYRFPENDVREPMFNYCPRCGAVMDGGQDA